MVEREREEGWYTDPFGRHEARWISDGTPTKLVRDGDVEAYDEPPDEDPSVPLTPIAEAHAGDGRDLLRAEDAAPAGSLSERMAEAGEYGASTMGSDLLASGNPDEG